MGETQWSGISGLGQVAINARDIERATRFYRDVLGLQFLFPAGKMAFFTCGGVSLMLSLPEEPEYDHAASILYFTVDDVAASQAVLAARGVEFRSAAHPVHRTEDKELWMTFFRDSEGNTLALQGWRPRA